MTTATARFMQHFAKNPHAWPGGYPQAALVDDSGILCHACVVDNYRLIREAQRDHDGSGWRVVSIFVNWEDTELQCDNCNKKIYAAYTDGETDSEGFGWAPANGITWDHEKD